jgi:hypothetical protein
VRGTGALLNLVLQRHRLVKGCGEKSSAADGSNMNEGSPPDRSEVMSDGADDSPTMGVTKKELASV